MKITDFDIHFEKLKEDEGYIEFFIEYAKANLHSSKEETKEILEKVLDICEKQNYILASGWSKMWLGGYYHAITNYEAALAFHTEALEIFLENNEKKGLANVYNALMGDYIKTGEFELAIEYSLTGLAIAEEVKDEKLVLSFLVNTATAYCYGGHYAEVDIMLDRILNLNFVIPEKILLLVKSIQADRNLYYGLYEEAYELCIESLKQSEIINYYYINTTFKHYMAKASFKMGDFKRALKEFSLAEEECINQQDLSTLTEVYIDWSEVYFNLENYEVSQKLLYQAAKKAQEISANNLLHIIYSKIGETYFNMGQYKEAYEASTASMEYNKKTFNSCSLNSFAKLKSKMVVDEAKVYKELYDQVTVISKIGKNITSNLNKEKTFQSTYEAVNTLMKADIFGIALYKSEENVLSYDYFVEAGEMKKWGDINLDEVDTFGVECFLKEKEIVYNNLETKVQEPSNKEYWISNGKVPKSVMFYPLISGEKALGIVSVQSYEKNAYTNNDMNKLKLLSSFIAVAIENAELFKEIEYLANYDSLTGIFNRRELLKAGEAVVEDCHSKKEASTVIMVDIDHFKRVNDTFGHQAGDFILKSVSGIIKSKISKEHLLGRYGGEEFLLVLPNYPVREAKNLSEDIRKSIAAFNFNIDKQHKISLSVSMGLYEVNNENNASFFDSIKHADEALYNAKKLGRNKVVEYH